MNRVLLIVVISAFMIMSSIASSVLAEPASRLTAVKQKNTKSLDSRKSVSNQKNLKFDFRTPKSVNVNVFTPKDPMAQQWKSYQRGLDLEGITRSDLNPESQVDYMLRTFF